MKSINLLKVQNYLLQSSKLLSESLMFQSLCHCASLCQRATYQDWDYKYLFKHNFR